MSVTPRRIGTTGWRSVVDGRPPGVEHLVLLLGEGCFFGLVPVGAGRTYGFAGTATGAGGGTAHERPNRFRDRFAAFGGPVSDYLTLLDGTAPHAAPIEDLELDGWHLGKVLLVGDAAHAMPPHAGQGDSLAAEDALGWPRSWTAPARCRPRSPASPCGAGSAWSGSAHRRAPRLRPGCSLRSSATRCCASAATGSCRSATPLRALP